MTHKHTHITLWDLNRVLRINNKKSCPNLLEISQKSYRIGSQALGKGSWATLVPRGPQDRKRDEKMPMLVAPRGTHRGLKIVIFKLKFQQNVKQVAPRTYLSKTIDFGSFLSTLGIKKIVKSV